MTLTPFAFDLLTAVVIELTHWSVVTAWAGLEAFARALQAMDNAPEAELHLVRLDTLKRL